MGLFSKVTGLDRRDELTARALAEAGSYRKKGLGNYTVTVHSTYSGPALLPRLTPFVVEQLQAAGHEVVGVQTDEWSYNSHISCRPASPAPTAAVPEHEQHLNPAPAAPVSSPRVGYMHSLPTDKLIDETLDFINWAMRGAVPTPMRAQARGWALQPGRFEIAVVPSEAIDAGQYAASEEGREVERWITDHDAWTHPDLVSHGPPSIVWFESSALEQQAEEWTPINPN